jgi:N-acetylglutamate synthase-like GNAT family acetyltransferase
MIEIRQAAFPDDLPAVQSLFREYASGVGVDLCFQGFKEELATLPGKYAPPRGRLLIATDASGAVGCVAIRPLDADACEMKRLYVRAQVRGEHLGRRLVERVCQEARNIGYARLCLDTLPSMVAAQRLYQSLGFLPIQPYVFNPVGGTKYLGLDLATLARLPAINS